MTVYGMSFTRIIREICDFSKYGIFTKELPDIEKELERYQSGSGYFLCYAWGAMVAT